MNIVCGFLFFIVGISQVSYADYLSINGLPDLTVTNQENIINISGHIELTNSGDEDALNVFPEIKIGNLKYIGQPVRLKADGGTHVWDILFESTIDSLEPTEDILLEKSKFGIYPVFIIRNYSDINGYKFSSVDIKRLSIPDGKDISFLHTSPFSMKLELNPKRNDFSAILQITNQRNQEFELMTKLLIPNEFLAKNPVQNIIIKPNESKSVVFEVENKKGLAGSSYAMYGTVEYNDRGYRNFQSIHNIHAVVKVRLTNMWITFISIASVIILLSFGYLLFLFKQK